MDQDQQKEFKAKLDKLKPKKPKLTVPEGFLDEAKSYEDKLVLVKMLAEKEKGRMLLIIKGMLKAAINDRDKK